MSESVANIALCGFMSAGKSTVGRALATALSVPFVDTDELLVASAGRTIPELFAAEGEAGFRRREREAVASAAALDGAVIALGGGVVRDPANVALLRRRGKIVWLRIDPATAAERILADGTGRPMIDDHIAERTPAAVAERAAELLAERLPAYQAAADLAIDVTGRRVDELVAAIRAALER